MPSLKIEDSEGDEHEMPAEHVQCWRCHGKGMITNPSIGAITGDEWERDWDEDERANYLRGVYDVHCTACDGKGTLLEVDEAQLTAAQRAIYEDWQESERIRNEPDWEQIAERRAGA